MHNVIIVVFVVGLLFLAGSAAAQPIALSAGPEAEGKRLISEAEAYGMTAQTDADRELAAFKLEEAKRQAEELRQSAIQKGIWWNNALKIGGAAFILITLLVGAFNAQAYFGFKNYRLLVTPIDHENKAGVTTTIPFPLLPFIAIQTWRDAPAVSFLYEPHKPPILTAHEDADVFALARLLRSDEDSDQKLGYLNLVLSKIKMMLDGVPKKLIDQSVQNNEPRQWVE